MEVIPIRPVSRETGFFISDVDESADSESVDSRLGRRLLDEEKFEVIFLISEPDLVGQLQERIWGFVC